MLLLRLSFENHKSFRDEVDLVLAVPSLKTNVPVEASWTESTTRVAAIYGPNASGKSGVLGALKYLRSAVANSATGKKGKRLPRTPFALDDESRERASTYSIDFVLDDIRYTYGFSVTSSQFIEEWLYNFPAGRKRVMFERTSPKQGVTFGRELGGGGPMLNRLTGERELVLSRAALLDHPVLLPIYESIVNGIDIASFGESDRHSRLRSVIEDVADGSLSLDDLHTMLRVADVGIRGAEVEDGEMDPQFLKVFRAVLDAQLETDDESEDGGSTPSDEQLEEMAASLARNLMFKHVGFGDRTYPLTSTQQSTGTLTWLSLAAPAISTIRNGGVLAIDELDASLHPQLAQVMIQMFRDESVNEKGAQLLFTTHDTYFISPASDSRLTPDEVWFVEKGRDGVSDLYRLADFPTRNDHNLSRRYLQGRFGAVPSVAPSFLAALANKSGATSLEAAPSDG